MRKLAVRAMYHSFSMSILDWPQNHQRKNAKLRLCWPVIYQMMIQTFNCLERTWKDLQYDVKSHTMTSFTTKFRPSYVVKNCPTVGNSPIIPSPPWCFFRVCHITRISNWWLEFEDFDVGSKSPFFFGWWQQDDMGYFMIYINYTYTRSTILSCLGFVDWLRSQVWAMHRHPRQLELKWINIIPKETIMHNRSKTGGILYIQSYLLLKFAHLLRDQSKLCLWKLKAS